MPPIISVDNLGKAYSIRHQSASADAAHRYRRLSEELLLLPRRILSSTFRLVQSNASTEEFWALKDVSFQINQGEVVGIIGRNGAGKSTLLKILSRITEPTTGRVELNGRVASLLEVGTGFHPELTGRENIFLNGAILGMTRTEIKRKFDEIVGFAEIEKFLDTPVKRYSSGMYVRLAFSVAAHLDPDVLIVDEVLAVGDAAFQKKCLGKMQDVASQNGRTVLFVSHNMGVISSLCTRAILLDQGSTVESGEPAAVILRYYSSGRTTPGYVDFARLNRPIGDSFARLLSGAVRNQSDELCTDFLLDDAIQLEMGFQILAERDYQGFHPYPAFHVYSASGECVFYSSPPNHQLTIWQPGEYLARCHVPARLLNAGTYFVSLGFAHSENGVHVSFNELNAVSFHVSEDLEQELDLRNGLTCPIPGCIRPNLNWSIRSIQHAQEHACAR